MDTNATFGNGDSINIPIGNIEKIIVYNRLLEMYDSVKAGADGVLYIEYGGSPVDKFLDFENPKLEKIEKSSNITSLSSLSKPIPVDNGFVLVRETTVAYKMSVPALVGENDLSIDVEKVVFKSFNIEPKIQLDNLSFPNPGEDAQLTLTVKFPSYFVVAGADEDNKVTRSVLLSELNEAEMSPIQVTSYSFKEEGKREITYRADLTGSAPVAFSANKPKFKFILESGELSVSYIDCIINGTKKIDGTENKFSDLQSAFGSDDVLTFRSPTLSLGIKSNLNAGFTLGFDLSRNEEKSSSLAAPLVFNETSKDTTYVLTQGKLPDFSEMVSTPFPSELKYAITLNFNSAKAQLPSSDKLDLSTSFKLPFDFHAIKLSLKDTIAGLFSEDTYDQIFSRIDDAFIEADLHNSMAGVDVDIQAVALDSVFKVIPDLVETTQTDNALSIAISYEDEARLKKARHLALTYILSGQGIIKKDDYIEIKNVRLVSSNGIHYEF
jgi:hypothetical protein